MKKLLPVLIAIGVIVGLVIGIAIYRRRHNRQTNKPWAAIPCANGLASVDITLQPTLKIDVLETNCENDIASVHFNVTNVGTTPYKYFEVRAIYSYENYVDDGAGFGTGPLVVGQSRDGYIGMGPARLASRKPVGQLRSITLAPALLEFPDGTKWRRPSIHEPK